MASEIVAASTRLGASLGEGIADQVRAAIITGEIVPGERLTENGVAQRFGVSTIPVREALQQLAQEGLVVKEPRRGTYVREFTAQDIRHLFMLRAALDRLAFRLLFQEKGLTKEGLEQLETFIARQRQAIEAQDYVQATELELRFHGLIYELVGSELLTSHWEMVRARLRVLMHWHIQGPPYKEEKRSLASHERILEALRQGDVNRVVAHIEHRYQETAADLIQVLVKKA